MAIGVMLGRGAGGLWVLLLAWALSPDSFNRYGLALSLVMLVTQVGTLRLQAAPQRLAFDHPQEGESLQRLLATCLWTPLLALLVAGALWWIAAPRDPITHGDGVLIAVLVLMAMATTGYDFLMTLAATEGADRTYAWMSSLVFPVASLTLLVLVGVVPITLSCVLVCQTLGFLVAVGLGVFGTRSGRVRWLWDARLLREAVRFSGPNAFGALGFWIAAMGGRWIAVTILATAEAALFTLFSFVHATWFSFVIAWIEGLRHELGPLQAANDHRSVLSVLSRTTLRLALLCLAANTLILVAFTATPVPRLIGYQPDVWTIVACTAAQLADLVVVKWHQLFIGMKRTGITAALCWLSALLSTSLGILLAPVAGAAGIFAGYALGGFAVLPLCWYLWRVVERKKA